MKIIVSLADAESFILSHLQSKGITGVSILKEAGDVNRAFSPYVAGIRNIQANFDYNGSQKIAAIKRLRELVPGLGLADAKMAVEQPEKAVTQFLLDGTMLSYYNNR